MSQPNTVKSLKKQLCTYDDCFAEFLKPEFNGQKPMQSILLRESFRHFSEQGVGIQKNSPTVILDVSCGRGDYSAAWTTQASEFLPQGMAFHCTDFKGGKCQDGTPYPTATANAIKAAFARGDVKLSGEPMGVEADLFSGTAPIISSGKMADIVHWSHSGYHVCDALGSQRNNLAAITQGLNTAIDKIWRALSEAGLMFSIHQTGDVSDGAPSEMLPLAKGYLQVLDDVPLRISQRVNERNGYISTVNFSTPLEFPTMTDTQWDSIKTPAQWEHSDTDQARVLRLLGFIAYNFANPNKSDLEVLAQNGRLALLIDDYRKAVENNDGHINVKCAFQMACKSKKIGDKLNYIASILRKNMPQYIDEMNKEMLQYRS